MTKEEYKKNLIRMWDSIRSNHKGENSCLGVSCTNCPLFYGISCNFFHGKACNTGSSMFYSRKIVEIVENWAKKHPVKTNAEKFKGGRK